jgi:hypothetical protein
VPPSTPVLWTPAFHQTSGQGKQHTITVTVTDDDGASDSEDIVLVATWKDRDNDGMADTWEQANGLDPTRDDANGDLDGDGVSNMAEFLDANGGPRLPADAVANEPLTGAKVKAAQLVLTTHNVTDEGDLTSVK